MTNIAQILTARRWPLWRKKIKDEMKELDCLKKKTINSKKGLVIFFKFQDWIKSRKVNNTRTEYPLTEFSDLIEFLSILNFISQRG